MAAHKKQERIKQVRLALLVALGLGGGFVGFQKWKASLKPATITQTVKKKIIKNAAGQDVEVEDTESAVGYEELLRTAPGQTAGGGTTRSANGSGDVASNTAGGGAAAAAAEEELKIDYDAVLLDEQPLILVGLDANRKETIERDHQLLDKAMETGAWVGYRKLLAKSLDKAMTALKQGDGRNRFDSYWSEPTFYQALLRWELLGRFKPSDIHEVAHDSNAKEMFNWLVYNNQALEEVLLTVKPEDDTAKVMVFLKDAWTAKPDQAKKYFNLALACAVVFDKPMEVRKPGGDTDYSSESTVDALNSRYLWYMEKNEKGKLVGPVHRTSARDLVYVVCVPVVRSEMEWAIDHMSLSRKNFGDAYGMIEYLMERAVKGINPYKEYTFAEIKKEGGICGDQSYFCANTARCLGIPAMIFSGETDLGGHAWVALKIKDDEWTTTVGRIGGVAKGQTDNPQVGGNTTEQEVWLWADREHQSDIHTLAVWRHLWLTEYFTANEKKSVAAEVARLSNLLGRSFVETWTKVYGVLEDETEAAGDPAKTEILDSWKKFAGDMRREFKDNPRMAALAAKAETEHIFPYSDEGLAKRSFLRDRRRTERDSSEQKDLIAESLKRESDLLVKRGDPTAKRDIGRLYDRALRDYGGSITGFKMMMADYYAFMKDDPELAKKAVRDIELAFNRVVATDSGDWFRTKTEAGIVTTLCGYYKELGDEDRAKMLAKRYERLMFRAERGAL